MRYGPLHMGSRCGEDPQFNCRKLRLRTLGPSPRCLGGSTAIDGEAPSAHEVLGAADWHPKDAPRASKHRFSGRIQPFS